MKGWTIFFGCMVLTSGMTFAGGETTVVTFDEGSMAWRGPQGDDGFGGGTVIQQSGGNPGAYVRTVFNDFGIEFYTSNNPFFLGDYTESETITISMDLKVEFLSFHGLDVSRPWILELRDFDGGQNGYAYNSVWIALDTVSEAENSSWETYSVSFDPGMVELPEGWGGTGAEDPDTFEPMLPDGIGFSDVLSGVDMVAFTTFEPGFFFGFSDHTLCADNVTITRGSACSADLTGEGDLNFLDVSAFLVAFGELDPIADFTGEGDFNFLDVSAFLKAFGAGCP